MEKERNKYEMKMLAIGSIGSAFVLKLLIDKAYQPGKKLNDFDKFVRNNYEWVSLVPYLLGIVGFFYIVVKAY